MLNLRTVNIDNFNKVSFSNQNKWITVIHHQVCIFRSHFAYIQLQISYKKDFLQMQKTKHHKSSAFEYDTQAFIPR